MLIFIGHVFMISNDEPFSVKSEVFVSELLESLAEMFPHYITYLHDFSIILKRALQNHEDMFPRHL